MTLKKGMIYYQVTQTTKYLFCSLELLFFVDILNVLLFNVDEVLQEFNFNQIEKF